MKKPEPPEHVLGVLPPTVEVYAIGSVAWGWRVGSDHGWHWTRAQAESSARKALARWIHDKGSV